DKPEVLLSERRAEEGRYLFVVNNSTPDLDPGQMWRMTLFVSSRVPVVANVRPGKAAAVYDVFAGKRVEPKDGGIEADCGCLPGRVFALLPAAIDRVSLGGPDKVALGGAFRWSVAVQDNAGNPLRASIPLRVCLKDTAGRVIEEYRGAAGSSGTSGV